MSTNTCYILDSNHQTSNQPSKPRKNKADGLSSEQTLLAEDQDNYSVTEYVMEYTGGTVSIFLLCNIPCYALLIVRCRL